MDSSAWRPDDKIWLEQRKPEWRKIQKHLKLFKIYFSGDYLKHHKELYFYGRIDPALEKKGGGGSFGYALPLFVFWYHPSPSLAAFQELFNSQMTADPLETAREYLFQKFPAASDFDESYGMFGGREELMVQTLMPSFDPKEEKQFITKRLNKLTGEEVEIISKFPLCLSPNLVARYCLNGIMAHIRGNKKNPYSPGQYLWDHLCVLVGDVTGKVSLERIRELAIKVITYESDDAFPRDNLVALSIAKRLKEKYDQRDFSEEMLTIWDEEKVKLGAA